jgi:hypothetical protein
MSAIGLWAADQEIPEFSFSPFVKADEPMPCSIPLLQAKEQARTKIRTVEPKFKGSIREVIPPAPPCDEPSTLPRSLTSAPHVIVVRPSPKWEYEKSEPEVAEPDSPDTPNERQDSEKPQPRK